MAASYRLPAIYPSREYPDAGGLVSYGPSIVHLFRQAASFVDKILKGARPADLPVEQPTKIELVINVKVAKALGLTVPPSLLTRADELIEETQPLYTQLAASAHVSSCDGFRTPAIRTYHRTRGLWPAFESRQGTKARGLGTRCGGRYGDYMSGTVVKRAPPPLLPFFFPCNPFFCST